MTLKIISENALEKKHIGEDSDQRAVLHLQMAYAHWFLNVFVYY